MLGMQAGAPPLRIWLVLPGKTIGHQRKLTGFAEVTDIGKPHQGILHVGRDDLQILRIERRKS
jgi:hypothetical protein